MKRVCILILVLLMAPSVLAASAVFDGRLYDNEPKEIDGVQLRVSSNYNRAAVTYGIHKFGLYVNKCTSDSFYEVCLRKTENNLFSEFSLTPKGFDISFNKVMDPDEDEFEVLDPIVVRLEVKNNGDLPVEFSIIDDIADFEITNIDNLCYKDGNNIVFNHTVRDKDIVICSYRARMLKPGDYKRKAVLTYFDGKEYKKIDKSISFDARELGFNVDVKFDKQIYEVADMALLTLKVSNTFEGEQGKSTIENLDITFSGISVTDHHPRFSNLGRYLQLRNLDMEAKSSAEYTFKLNVTKIDNTMSIVYRALTPKGYKDTTIKKTLEVASIKPDVVIQRLSDTKFKIYVTNINKNRAMHNFKIRLRSNYQNVELERTFAEIPAGGKAVVDLMLQPFEKRPETAYPLFATGNYETEFGEALTFSKTMQIDLRFPMTEQQVQEAKKEDGITVSSQVADGGNVTAAEGKGFSFFKWLKNLFSRGNATAENETVSEKAIEVNATASKSLGDRLAFLKPSKKDLMIGVVIVVVVALAVLAFFLRKRHKKVQHIDVKLKDVKL